MLNNMADGKVVKDAEMPNLTASIMKRPAGNIGRNNQPPTKRRMCKKSMGPSVGVGSRKQAAPDATELLIREVTNIKDISKSNAMRGRCALLLQQPRAALPQRKFNILRNTKYSLKMPDKIAVIDVHLIDSGSYGVHKFDSIPVDASGRPITEITPDTEGVLHLPWEPDATTAFSVAARVAGWESLL